MNSEPLIDGWTLAVAGVVTFCLGVMVGAALVRA